MGTEPLGLTSPCLLQWKAPIPPWNPCFLQSKILQGFTTARPAGCLPFISSCYPGLFSPGGWTSLLKLLYISPVLGIASGSKNLLRDQAPEESAQHGPSFHAAWLDWTQSHSQTSLLHRASASLSPAICVYLEKWFPLLYSAFLWAPSPAQFSVLSVYFHFSFFPIDSTPWKYSRNRVCPVIFSYT